MTLPLLNPEGELPEGVHRATIEEVLERFGEGMPQRRLVTARLLRVFGVAHDTGKLLRFVIFGSYVTAKPDPNDVDIILVMADDFDVAECDEQSKLLFDHLLAQRTFGASVFSVRPSTALLETVDEFLAYWQVKRDKGRRGIVEVIWEAGQ
jgi:predicted nucleotidyltransferase